MFDYAGFPPHTYQYRYPAPAPRARGRLAKRLNQAGIAAGTQVRNWDHGCFVPLMLSPPPQGGYSGGAIIPPAGA